MNKRDNGLIDLSGLDPAVASVLGRGQQRQEEARQPLKDRKRQRKEREKMAKRNRVVWDVPEGLEKRLTDLAKREGTSASGLAALAIQRLLEDVEAGELDLHDYKVVIDNPRYEYRIVLSGNEE